MSDLVPDTVWNLLAEGPGSLMRVIDANGSPSEITSLIAECVRAAAPLILAAEMERQARELDARGHAYETPAGKSRREQAEDDGRALACFEEAARNRSRASQLRGEVSS